MQGTAQGAQREAWKLGSVGGSMEHLCSQHERHGRGRRLLCRRVNGHRVLHKDRDLLCVQICCNILASSIPLHASALSSALLAPCGISSALSRSSPTLKVSSPLWHHAISQCLAC